MAQHPARQLNSKSIRDAAISYMIPEVQGKFCAVSAICVWRVEDKPSSLSRAWELICEKRSECDSAIDDLNGVAFYFSSITTSESAKREKGKRALDECDEIEDEEEASISCSQDDNQCEISTSSAIKSAIQKGRLPTIVYWIALESPNGAPVSLVNLQRNLLKCDVEIDTRILSLSKGTPAQRNTTKRLCSTLKDHNSSYIGQIVSFSYEMCFCEATNQLDINLDESKEEMEEHVLRFVVHNTPNPRSLQTAVDSLLRAGLVMDVIGLQTATTKASSFVPMTTDVFTQLIHDIEVLMSRFGYAMHHGMVYKKHPKALYTYIFKCDVNSFIGALEGNETFKPRLLKYGDRLKEKLKNPKSQLIEQLEVSYDLLEVKNGWCLSLTNRDFVKVVFLVIFELIEFLSTK